MSKAPERIWVAPDGGDIIIHNGKPNLDTLIAAGHISEYVSVRCIKKLEAENHLLKTSGIAEVAVRNPNVMEYMRHWEGRAERAEAKLAKAVRLMDLSVELARWELNPKLQHDVIVFCNDLKGYNDEPNK